MVDESPILKLPVEILQRIARFVAQPTTSSKYSPVPTPLLPFRLTCKSFEKSSFDVLVEVYPQDILCHVVSPESIKNFKSQTSQRRLAAKLKQVTLIVDIHGGSDASDISTVEQEGQDLQAAQLFDCNRLEADFYSGAVSPSNADLCLALQNLQALPEPPSIKIFAWLSEDVYLEHAESKNISPILSDIMATLPQDMLQSLHLAYTHCDPESVFRLLRASYNTIEEFNMDNVSLVSSRPRWREILLELTQCTKLSRLCLCNLHEECFGQVLSTRQPSRYSPHSGYFLAGFYGIENVAEGLQTLIDAELSPAEATEGY